MTSTPLCTVRWCAHPSDPDWHTCIVCGALATEHAHVQSRAQAPARKKDKSNQVMLCNNHHREVDERQNGTHSHHIRTTPGKGRLYFRMDLHGNTLFEKVLEPDSAAASTVGVPDVSIGDGSSPSAAAPSGSGSPAAKEQTNRERVRVGKTDGNLAAEPSESLTHEKRIEICKQIRWMQQNRQWHTGDTANEWEEELGVEEFHNLYANEFGYSYPSLRNCMRVAKKIPENERHYEVSFGHEAAVYAWMNLEDRDAWLPRAHDEGWNVARFKDALREEGLLPPRKTVKRWTLEELWEAAKQRGEHLTIIGNFLDWLEEQA